MSGFFGGESSSASSSGGLFGGAASGGGKASLLGSVPGLGAAASASGADVLFGVATPGLFDTPCPCSMTKKQRLYGFLGCFAAGVFVTLLSTVFVWTGNFTGFGVAYSTGNLLAIASTFFIMGPRTQCRNMFHKNRAVASCVYLGALVATVAVAFTIKNGILVLCLVGVQAAALLWYSLSYIPFARQLVTRAVKNLCASGASG